MKDDKDDKIMKIHWDWIERPVPESFYLTAGKLKNAEILKRFNEIPDEIKPLAKFIITIACKDVQHGHGFDEPHSCLRMRIMLFEISEKLEEQTGIDIGLPSYWWTDGVMIEPDWIVRLSNGIIGWCCDSSVNECCLTASGKCRFYDAKYLNKK